VFVFAALNNSSLLARTALRKIFEEEMLGGDMTRRYVRNFELKKKKAPHLDSFLSREYREQISPRKEGASSDILQAAVTGIEKRLNILGEQVRTVQLWLITGAVVLAAILYFRH
jgi:hypothetical protein